MCVILPYNTTFVVEIVSEKQTNWADTTLAPLYYYVLNPFVMYLENLHYSLGEERVHMVPTTSYGACGLQITNVSPSAVL